MQVFQQIGVAAHDQLPVLGFAAGPAGDAGRNHLLRQLIEFGAALRQRGFEFQPGFGERSPANPRVEEIAGFRQRRRGNAGRQHQDAVFDLTVLADQHNQRALRLQPHEFDVFQPRIGFGGQHHGGRPGQSRQPRQGFAKGGLDRLRAADGGKLGLDR